MSDVLAKHWFDLAGCKYVCLLEGIGGPRRGEVQFPLSPDEPVRVFSLDEHKPISFQISLRIAARRVVESLDRGEIPTFYYS